MTPAVMGRTAERGAIDALLDGGLVGAAALVLEGAPGIGKTTIWLAALENARARGYAVLSCRPDEAEATLPFVSLGDMLGPVADPFLPDLPASQRAALEAALSRIEPSAAYGTLAVSRAAVALLRMVALDGPALLAIDDVQWLDEPSRVVLEFIMRRIADLPVRVLVAGRASPDGAAPLGLTRALGPTRVTVLRLGPLDIGDLDRMLRAGLGLGLARPTLLELHRISGGNPMYAREIAHASAAGRREAGALTLVVPESLGALLRARLDALPAPAADAVLLAAAASHPTVALVERAAGRPDGLSDALRAGILEKDGQRIRFSHPLYASVAYEAAFPGARAAAHGRLAEASDDPEERARHLARGTTEPSVEASAALDRATRLAVVRGAPGAAASLAEHAARLTPAGQDDERRRRLAEAAEAHVASGDPARGREILEDLIADLAPGPARADLLWRLADAVGDDLAMSIDLCERALLEAGGDPAIEAQVHTALGVFTWLAGDLARAAGHCRASAACAERAGDRLLVAVSLGELCHAETVLGHPYPEADMARALAIEREIGSFPPNMRPSFQLGVIRLYTDDPDGARPMLQDELDRALAAGDEASRFGVLFRLAELELRAGDWAVAARCAGEALDAALQAGIEQEQSVLLMVDGLVRAHLGDLDTASEEAARALAIAEAGGDRIVALRARGVLGFVELSRGDPRAALDHLGPAGRELRALGIGELSISGVLQNEIEALCAVGRIDEAEAAVDFVEECGRPTGRAWHAAVAARGRALVAAARGDADGARVAIRAAHEAHARLPQPFELARTLLVEGEIARRSRDRGTARRALIAALDLFDALGAARWSERAADELARIPGRAPGSGDLSETERRVAELAAAGLSNKEIAARLFISVRTVEANLSRVFAKLGVRSRTELAARHGRALPPD